MPETMGQIIKRLRKERNFTQEELAEQLNVSSQAVSKWENDTSMPDITQIVPLASVFKVNTDVLFGVFGKSDDEEAAKIISHAQKNITSPPDKEGISKAYSEVQQGLKKYPNNAMLLMQNLEYGISLAYPENETYDETRCREIYQECVRQANLVVTYSKNVSDILRAHMIMVMLHSAYGNTKQAEEHADKFPWRCDFTSYCMNTYIASAENDRQSEIKNLQLDFILHFEAIMDDIDRLGRTYEKTGAYNDAIKVFSTAFMLIGTVYGGEDFVPPLHCRDSGDIFIHLAKTYLKADDRDNALLTLEKMTEYDTAVRNKFKSRNTTETPFARGSGFPFYDVNSGFPDRLRKKLNDAAFESLKSEDRYKSLLRKATAADENL